jgi:hypothetical protein
LRLACQFRRLHPWQYPRPLAEFRLRGFVAATFTPFTADAALDLAGLKAAMERQLAACGFFEWTRR